MNQTQIEQSIRQLAETQNLADEGLLAILSAPLSESEAGFSASFAESQPGFSASFAESRPGSPASFTAPQPGSSAEARRTRISYTPTPLDKALFSAADAVRQSYYGKKVFLRGLIEFSNYCKNDCYYCGIRRSNQGLKRYRLEETDIMECCRTGYSYGLRTFVLQSGEDAHFNQDVRQLSQLVRRIKDTWPDCAVTLSVGELDRERYEMLYEAGADRYLLRHETAAETLYRKWHPDGMSLAYRKQCLYELKEIGYQVGAGFMVGAPEQTAEDLLADLRFLQELQPDMIGIGPFLHHRDTPFRDAPDGSFALTLRCLALLRLLFPYALLPATTALGTIHPLGRELGLSAGANVIMPNISPGSVRGQYLLYDGKICTDEDGQHCHACLEARVRSRGYEIACERGDAVRSPRERAMP